VRVHSCRPILCHFPVHPKEDTSPGSREDVGRVAKVCGKGETVCGGAESYSMFGKMVWWEDVDTNRSSNGVKISTLFHRASSATLISALTSTSIGRCWKASSVGVTSRW